MSEKKRAGPARPPKKKTELLRFLPFQLSQFRFNSIRARGLAVGTGLVLLAVVVAVSAYTLSLRAYYFSAMRSALEAKAEAASEYFTSYVSRTYAEYYQSAYNYAESFEDRDSLELQFVNTRGRVEVSSTGISARIHCWLRRH